LARRARNQGQNAEEGTAKITSILTSVPVDSLKLDDRDCPICHEPYEPEPGGEVIDNHEPAQLPCGHAFGRECITEWLKPTTPALSAAVTTAVNCACGPQRQS
jgi:hypothetical protein